MAYRLNPFQRSKSAVTITCHHQTIPVTAFEKALGTLPRARTVRGNSTAASMINRSYYLVHLDRWAEFGTYNSILTIRELMLCRIK